MDLLLQIFLCGESAAFPSHVVRYSHLRQGGGGFGGPTSVRHLWHIYRRWEYPLHNPDFPLGRFDLRSSEVVAPAGVYAQWQINDFILFQNNIQAASCRILLKTANDQFP